MSWRDAPVVESPTSWRDAPLAEPSWRDAPLAGGDGAALAPAPDEREFQQWYADQSQRWGLDPNPDDPQHFYDYRAAWRAGAEADKTGHWPSQFKREGHPNLIVDGLDTRTGQPAGDWRPADQPGWRPSTETGTGEFIWKMGAVTALMGSGSLQESRENQRQATEDFQKQFRRAPTEFEQDAYRQVAAIHGDAAHAAAYYASQKISKKDKLRWRSIVERYAQEEPEKQQAFLAALDEQLKMATSPPGTAGYLLGKYVAAAHETIGAAAQSMGVGGSEPNKRLLDFEFQIQGLLQSRLEGKDRGRLAKGAGGAAGMVPWMTKILAGYTVAGAALPFRVMGGMAASYPDIKQQAEREFRLEGMEPEKAEQMARMTGVAESMLEMVVPVPYLNRLGKGGAGALMRRWAIDFFKEWFAEEGSQALSRHAFRKLGHRLGRTEPPAGTERTAWSEFKGALQESFLPLLFLMGPRMVQSGVLDVKHAIQSASRSAIAREHFVSPGVAALWAAEHPDQAAALSDRPSRTSWEEQGLPKSTSVDQRAQFTMWAREALAIQEAAQEIGTQQPQIAPGGPPVQQQAPGAVPTEEAAGAAETAEVARQEADRLQARVREHRAAPADVLHPMAEEANWASAEAIRLEGITEQAPEPLGRTPRTAEATGIAETLPVGDLQTAARQGQRAGRRLVQWLFSSRRGMPEAAFQLDQRRRGQIERSVTTFLQRIKDFDRAMRKHLGARKLSSEDQLRLSSVLRGELPLDSLPEDVRGAVTELRRDIDALSRRMIDAGVVEGELAATIDENMGVYLHRTYRAFRDPGWAKKVPPQVREQAKAFIRAEHPELSDQEVDQVINALLFKAQEAGTPMALLAKAQTGAKELSILKRRKDIPKQIRELWGEEQDPRANYLLSVGKMAQLLANHEFLAQVREAGLGEFFYKPGEGAVPENVAEMSALIAADASQVMYPLNGLYTTPEIKRAFERSITPRALPWYYRYLLKGIGVTKFAKTALSVMTQVRNILAWPKIFIGQGHFIFRGWKRAGQAILVDWRNKSVQEWRDYYARAIEVGVARESVRGNELRDAIQGYATEDLDALLWDVEKRRANAASRLWKGSAKVAAHAYQSGDEIPKLMLWEMEKRRYRNAHPEWSEAQVEEHAASIVRDVSPTYSMLPESIRALRRFPLIGSFPSFAAERFRNFYNTLALVKRELDDPQTRSIGAARLAGLLSSLALTTAAAKIALYLAGMDDDEDEAFRKVALPEWQENNQLIHFGKDPSGTYRYLDVSYLDPDQYLVTPVVAFMRGEDWESSFYDAAAEWGQPFFSREMWVDAFLKAYMENSKTTGSMSEETWNYVEHLWDDAFKPGTLASGERIVKGLKGEVSPGGMAYDAKIEAIATFTGQRLQQRDPSQAYLWKLGEFSRELPKISRPFTSLVYSKGSVSEAGLRNAHAAMEEQRQLLFKRTSDVTDAVAKLGLSSTDIRRLLKASRISEQNQSDLRRGVYSPYEIGASGRQLIKERAPTTAEYQQRRAVLRELGVF